MSDKIPILNVSVTDGLKYPNIIKVTCNMRYADYVFTDYYLSLYCDDELLQREFCTNDDGIIIFNIFNQKPSDNEIEYKIVYEGNKEYGSVTEYVTFNYYKPTLTLTEIDVADNKPQNYIEENCKINLSLKMGNRPIVKPVNYECTYLNISGSTRVDYGTLMPNSYGVISYSTSTDLLSTANVIFTVDDDEYYNGTSYETDFEWVPKFTAETILKLETPDIYYKAGYKPTHMKVIVENTEGQRIDGIVDFYVDGLLVLTSETVGGYAYAVNPNTPREEPFEYRVDFRGKDEYAPTSVSQTAYYYKQTPIFTVVKNTHTVPPGEDNEIQFMFSRSEGNQLTNSALRHSITYRNNEGTVIRTATGSGRTDSNGVYTVTPSLNGEGYAEVTVSFNTTSSASTFGTASKTVNCYWVEKDGSYVNSSFDRGSPFYPEELEITGQVENTAPEASISLLCDGVEVETTVTDNGGLFEFYTVPSPNKFSDENDYHIYSFEYDDNGEIKTQNACRIKHINTSTFTVSAVSNTVPIGNNGTINIRLSDYERNIDNVPVNISIVGYDDGQKITLDESVENQTVSTNNNGEIVFPFNAPSIGVYDFTFTFNGDGNSPPTETVKTVTFNKLQTNLTILNEDTDLEVTDTGSIQLKLTNNYGTIITDKEILCNLKVITEDNEEIIIHSSDYDPLILTTDSQGIITPDYTPDIIGGITGEFEFICIEDDLYQSSTVSTSLYWDYMETELIPLEFTYYTKASLLGKFATRLKRTKDNLVIPNQIIKTEIDFYDNDTDGNPFLIEFSNGVDFTQDKITDTTGKIHTGYIPFKGLLWGYFTFTFEGNNLYKPSQFNPFDDDVYIEWDKIETSITANDVTTYAGRYTDFSIDRSTKVLSLLDNEKVGVDWTYLEISAYEEEPEDNYYDDDGVKLGRNERNIFKIPFNRNAKYKIHFMNGFGSYIGLCNGYEDLRKWETVYVTTSTGFVSGENDVEITIDGENITLLVNNTTTHSKTIANSYGEYLYFVQYQHNNYNPMIVTEISEIIDIPLNEQSVGVDPEYTNFYAKVEPLETSFLEVTSDMDGNFTELEREVSNMGYLTNHTLEGGKVYWRTNYNSARVWPIYEGDLPDYYFWGTLDENYETHVRWTTTGNPLNIGENTIRVDFMGEDMFYSSSTRITYTLLRRSQPILEVEIEPLEEYDYAVKYNIPLGLNMALYEENGSPLPNIPLTVTLDEEVIGVYTTGNDGTVSTTILPNTTGHVPLRVHYNYGDNIDRWI